MAAPLTLLRTMPRTQAERRPACCLGPHGGHAAALAPGHELPAGWGTAAGHRPACLLAYHMRTQYCGLPTLITSHLPFALAHALPQVPCPAHGATCPQLMAACRALCECAGSKRPYAMQQRHCIPAATLTLSLLCPRAQRALPQPHQRGSLWPQRSHTARLPAVQRHRAACHYCEWAITWSRAVCADHLHHTRLDQRQSDVHSLQHVRLHP